MRRLWAASTAIVAAALVLAGCGGEPSQDREDDPFSAVPREPPKSPLDADRAAPRWEHVATLRGGGSTTREVAIARSSEQWRAKLRCRSGFVDVTAAVRRHGGAAKAHSECPGGARFRSAETGRLTITVRANGAWQLRIEQRVTQPLHEPAPTAVRRGVARRVASGALYPVERQTRGNAALYQLPAGRLIVRLAPFVTERGQDLVVWASRAARPESSHAALQSHHVTVARLKATAGTQNYVLSRRLTIDDVRSVVIWCIPLRIAYAAVALQRNERRPEHNLAPG